MCRGSTVAGVTWENVHSVNRVRGDAGTNAVAQLTRILGGHLVELGNQSSQLAFVGWKKRICRQIRLWNRCQLNRVAPCSHPVVGAGPEGPDAKPRKVCGSGRLGTSHRCCRRWLEYQRWGCVALVRVVSCVSLSVCRLARPQTRYWSNAFSTSRAPVASPVTAIAPVSMSEAGVV